MLQDLTNLLEQVRVAKVRMRYMGIAVEISGYRGA